jgi:hypothetical protein
LARWIPNGVIRSELDARRVGLGMMLCSRSCLFFCLSTTTTTTTTTIKAFPLSCYLVSPYWVSIISSSWIWSICLYVCYRVRVIFTPLPLSDGRPTRRLGGHVTCRQPVDECYRHLGVRSVFSSQREKEVGEMMIIEREDGSFAKDGLGRCSGMRLWMIHLRAHWWWGMTS